RFEQIVSELARSQMMEAEVRTEALAHSEECERCLARLRDEETLTCGLQMLAGDMESLEAPPAIELKLREAFREQRVVAPVAVGSSRSRYWLVAVAAVLLLAMSVAAMWWRSDTPQQQIAEKTPTKAPEIVGSSEPAPAPAPKEVEYQAGNREPVENPKRQLPKPVRRNVNRRAPETPVAHHTTNEIATDFVPLGDMNQAMLQDGGQIIRVKLRRSALVKFGFPVNMERYNENVNADVLIGVDGLARAIRFVQ
ncbi:MAG TPA: hypothetical protein VN844_26485, partial [Pyrinomonadaceae bacterium]|nr:hypothetical protein [Pyrinomonadaceae bacterium]